MNHFVEISLPTPLRKTFTYKVPESLKDQVVIGKRVWIPLRGKMAIGMVVEIHKSQPEFDTKDVRQVLDEEPLFMPNELQLFEWISRFYYCSLGEVIQAALPSGLNFISRERVRINEDASTNGLSEVEQKILGLIREEEALSLKDLNGRFHDHAQQKVVKSLKKRGILEVWEEPELKMKEIRKKVWFWNGDVEHYLNNYEGKDHKWVHALRKLHELGLPKSQVELVQENEITSAQLTRIEKAGIIRSEMIEWNQFDDLKETEERIINPLNEDQERVYEPIEKAIEKGDYKSFLLHGVTGSGKTEVYIKALSEALKKGKSGLIMVPEIALTPQFVSRFYKAFGNEIAIYHSRLNDRERKEAWESVRNNEKKIIIGTRSSIFMPVTNLGIIILDEEHDQSYKQEDPAPRYHARDIALYRAVQEKAVVVLGSATPSMQALYLAQEGKSEYLSLDKRHADAVLPEVKILDLTQYRSAMRGPLAVPLFIAIEEALERNEQIVLLHNRRGYSSYLQCMNCGHIPQSPEASVSLTYHKGKNMLLCHYSGYSRRADTKCESCGSTELVSKGMGSQQLEEEITRLFPNARILRMDRDTTSGKNAHADIIQKFEKKEADILLGTQIVAKGLDFPDVTVVGVIDADTELAFPSFQSTERSFQLLSQVSGRAGRANKKGYVFIQTRQPDFISANELVNHDFNTFSKKELAFRESLNYPPYSRLISIFFKGKNENEVRSAAHLYASVAQQLLEADQTLGPSPSTIQMLNGNYYWEFSIKMPLDKGDKFIEHFFQTIDEHYFAKKPPSGVRINVNVGKVS